MKSSHHIKPLKRNPRSTWPCVSIIFGIIAVAFGVLNFLTPEYHDDYIYKFMFEGGSVNYDHPIRSLGDIVSSQLDHYHSVNGRSLVHTLVQLFTGLLGKPIFNILNIIMFGIFVWMLKKFLRRPSCDVPAMALTLTLVLLLPRFKDTFLWMTGSVNYLWSATATLLFLLMHEKQQHQHIDKRLPVMLVAAFLLGWTHEGITLPLGAALVITHILSFKHSRSRQGLWLTLAFFAGSCMSALAPGTIARSGLGSGITASTIGLKVVAGFTVLGQLKIVYLALLVSVVAWITRREIVMNALRRDGFLLLAILFSCGIVLTSGLQSSRTAFGLELFSMIYLLRLVGDLIPLQRPAAWRWCGIGLSIGLMAFYGLLLRHTIPSWQESQRLIAQIERTDDGIIGTNEHHAGFFSSYICTMLSPDSTVNAINYDPEGWPASIAATYHRDSLVFLPQSFLEDLRMHPDRFEKPVLSSPYQFFVQRIDDHAEINGVEFLLAPNDFTDIPFLFRPIAKKMSRYTDTTVATDKWVSLMLYGRRYLFIKRDHDLEKRLIDIRITTQAEEQSD